jgi:NADP-dependent 3-hydroxy acid dehydrogenase YdfG
VSHPLAVVIGAGPGIGSATAHRFGSLGYDVGLVARDEGRLAALGGELQAAGVTTGWSPVDVTDAQELTAAITRFVEHAGRLDVLVVNPSRYRAQSAVETTAAELLADLAVGTAPLLTAVRAGLPAMRAQRTGTILATGGGSADRPFPGAATLGVQKAALRALVVALAQDLRPDGVHVATLTIRGTVKDGTAFSPDVVAQVYAELAEQTASAPENWQTVLDLTADGVVPRDRP